MRGISGGSRLGHALPFLVYTGIPIRAGIDGLFAFLVSAYGTGWDLFMEHG